MKLPQSMQNLIERLSELPSIGPRQAFRLVFYLVSSGKNTIWNLARDMDDLQKIKICERCFFVHQNQNNLCDICSDKKRRQNIIAVVGKETDLISLENTGKFIGRYLIIGEIPKAGALEEWQKLRLQNLKNFIQKELGGKAAEIVLAFNPTRYGDWISALITQELMPFSEKISRLGRGLPYGGEIEFADDETLMQAIEQRK